MSRERMGPRGGVRGFDDGRGHFRRYWYCCDGDGRRCFSFPIERGVAVVVGDVCREETMSWWGG